MFVESVRPTDVVIDQATNQNANMLAVLADRRLASMSATQHPRGLRPAESDDLPGVAFSNEGFAKGFGITEASPDREVRECRQNLSNRAPFCLGHGPA
jgi:hypothetical protein